MSYPKYQQLIEDVPDDAPNPAPYSEHQADKESDVPKKPTGTPPLMRNGVPPPKPSKGQPSHYSPPNAGSHRQPGCPSPQTVVITPIEVSEEPDFIGCSICVALFCCFFLGALAFFFSKRTQRANRIGDRKAAQRNAKIAFTLSIMSLVTGVVCWIVYFVLRMRS